MGAGKSSLVEFLHFRYGFEPIYEPFMDNPYLDDFYKDMKRWSFQSQIYFLTHKFRLHIGLLSFKTPSFKIEPSMKTQKSFAPISTKMETCPKETIRPIWNSIRVCGRLFSHQTFSIT